MRRHVPPPAPGLAAIPTAVSSPPSDTPPRVGRSKSDAHLRSSHGGDGGICSSKVLFIIAVIITIATYRFPEVKEIEMEAIHAEQQLEKEMVDWWQGQGQRQPPNADHPDHSEDGKHFNANEETSEEATRRMMAQESKWVDGEKKLKAKLKKLAELQSQGKDLGAPVLTRYLGEDIPAWAGEGVDEAEWNKKVKAEYDRMREEEEEWRRKVWATLQNKKHG
jgi:hypothetical protein